MNIQAFFIILFLTFQGPTAPPTTGSTSQPQTLPFARGAVSDLVGVEAPIISEEYILMPGDHLLVTVSGKINYSYNTWVTYEGKVSIVIKSPLHSTFETVDVVQISGLTLKTAQDSLAKIFLKYFKDVKIKVTLVGLRHGVVFVTGEVFNPGAYYALPTERVSQIIAKAGGIRPNGSRINIKLFRNSQRLMMVNIEKFEREGDVSSNPFVESGDRIYVPPITSSVKVKGAVFGRDEYQLRTSPLTGEQERLSEGIYELEDGERLLSVINKAGGVTPWADLDGAYIERELPGASQVRIPLNLRELLINNNLSYNIELKNGDVIVIPQVKDQVYVSGEVTNPSGLTYVPGFSIDHYIAAAGGITSYGNPGKIYILRGNKRISAAKDLIILPGDIIFVPRVSLKWWQDYLQITSAVFPIALTILYALTR